MTTLLAATTNRHKLCEIRSLLAGTTVDVAALDSLPPIPEPRETGETFEDNARLKALYYDRNAKALRHAAAKALRHPDHGGAGLQPCVLTVAEDSGLIIDALDGEPGVRSARFLRPDATYPERFEEIFRRLALHPDRPRTARFVCALCLVQDGRVLFEARGTIEGEIATAPRGSGGFGYDPIFYYPPYGCTLAEVTEDDKLRVAHRGQAFRALAAWLHAHAGVRADNRGEKGGD